MRTAVQNLVSGSPTASSFASMDSPFLLAMALLVSLLLGALLLMWVVRRTEGFAISFRAALKITALATLAAAACEIAVFAVVLWLGDATPIMYAIGILLTLLLSMLLYTLVYAFGVKHPDGRRIGMKRATKVTLIQMLLSVAVIVVVAVVLAIFVSSGVIRMPELPTNLLTISRI